jgi:hypothetical protein
MPGFFHAPTAMGRYRAAGMIALVMASCGALYFLEKHPRLPAISSLASLDKIDRHN